MMKTKMRTALRTRRRKRRISEVSEKQKRGSCRLESICLDFRACLPCLGSFCDELILSDSVLLDFLENAVSTQSLLTEAMKGVSS